MVLTQSARRGILAVPKNSERIPLQMSPGWVPRLQKTSKDREHYVKIYIYDGYKEMCRAAGRIVRRTLNEKPNAVLGLATGSTPLGLYQEMIRMYKEDGLDFSQVRTFNLDEYVGLSREHPQSYYHFMHENLFDHINIPPQNIHVPTGTTDNYGAFCAWYEQQIKDAGGIDLQVLGIGTDGHIGFNEPSSSLGSRTRIKTLSQQTIGDNARFFEKAEDVPIYSITMGVGTILEARKIVLLANGASKADTIAGAVEGPISAMNTASALQLHPDTTMILDREAAAGLKMIDYYEWIQSKAPGAPEGF